MADKSSSLDIALDEQRSAWNHWNESGREKKLGPVSELQSAQVLAWIAALLRSDLDIIDVGCGAGWMSERLAAFGRVTGTDLADEVLERARVRAPHITYISGDFMTLALRPEGFDIAVSLEVLSHVRDQPAFLRRVASLLRPGGRLLLATQNRTVLERWSGVGTATPGQLRHWVNARELRRLLRADFERVELTSVMPVGDQGFLRLVNSTKANRALARVLPGRWIERAKERLLLGHTLMAHARKRAAAN